MVEIAEALLEGREISGHQLAWLKSKLHPERDYDEQRVDQQERNRMLCALKPTIVLYDPRARAIVRSLTSYRDSAWQYERSLAEAEVPERHRAKWQILQLTGEQIPAVRTLRGILAKGARDGQPADR